MDRYAYSGVAFSSAKNVPGMDFAWCKAPDAGLPMPDVIFFMDIPVEKAAARAGFGGERYENPAFQTKVRGLFDALRAEASSDASSFWCNVDAAGTIEDIHALLLAKTKDVAATAATSPMRKLWSGEHM
jgi:dTMP kinase